MCSVFFPLCITNCFICAFMQQNMTKPTVVQELVTKIGIVV